MATVNKKDNPIRSTVGSLSADATRITAGYVGGKVTYQFRRADRQGTTMTFSTDVDHSTSTIVVECVPDYIDVILPFRTVMEYRIKRNNGSWSGWEAFKTRDKRYQSPDAITQIQFSVDSTPQQKRNKTITVVNEAKATVTRTGRGATVVNSKKGYVSESSVTYTNRGATIRNVD